MPTFRRRYSTDLTDRQWGLLEPLVPPPKPGGRPCRWSRREILNGIFYELRSGCAWRLVPHDLPPWQTVYHYLRLWRRDGTLEAIHARLREQVRRRLGREPTPSAAILDSQSVKTAERGAPRLRRRQEGQGPQTPPAGRYPRAAAQSRGPRGRRAGPRRRPAGTGGDRSLVPTPAAPVG